MCSFNCGSQRRICAHIISQFEPKKKLQRFGSERPEEAAFGAFGAFGAAVSAVVEQRGAPTCE